MRYDEAPLYVRAYDLVRYVLERTARFPKQQRFVLAARMEGAAFDLLDAVTLALLEPAGRLDRVRAADEAASRLRVAVRLSKDLALLRDNQAAFLHRELSEVGKMIGGWRKKISGPPPSRAD